MREVTGLDNQREESMLNSSKNPSEITGTEMYFYYLKKNFSFLPLTAFLIKKNQFYRMNFSGGFY